MFGKKEQTDPHETTNDVAYKLCPDNHTVHSKIVGTHKYCVDGFVFENCESHSEAYSLYMEKLKKKVYNNE